MSLEQRISDSVMMLKIQLCVTGIHDILNTSKTENQYSQHSHFTTLLKIFPFMEE